MIPAQGSTKIKSGGFTLLEIMIAVFIFAIVLTTLFGSFQALFTDTEVLNGHMDAYEEAKNCLRRMTLDLRSIQVTLPPKYEVPKDSETHDPERFVGELLVTDESIPKLRFTSLSHLDLTQAGSSGLCEIIYFMDHTEEGWTLKRSDRIFFDKPFDQENWAPVLCRGLKSLKLTYYNKDGDALDTWDSDSDEFGFSTPRAVGIELELDKDSRIFTFKTMVKLPVYREKKES